MTLIEARPDGQEMYVQNGWLRLSHRKLDEARSTALQPMHTHLRADQQQLAPSEPVQARVEFMPFNHVFRAGSAIRLQIDAPGGYFQITPLPAVNSIYHDVARPSALVLGWLPGGEAQAPLPQCGTLLNQPCRESEEPTPPGSLLVSGNSASSTPYTGSVSRADTGGCNAGLGSYDPIWLTMLLLAWLGLRRARI